jgi:hypothetical protein
MAVTNAQILEFLKTPNLTDAQIVAAMQEAKVTPAQLAQATGAPVKDVAVRFAQAVAPTVTDYQGKEYDSATLIKLSQQITSAIDPKNVKGGVFSTSGESVGFNYDESSKILGKAPTATEQVVLDMARHLIKEGYTDLNQANATETNRRFGSTYTGGGGTIYELKKNADGSPVISTWSKDTSNRKEILGGLALAALAFGIPGVTEGLLSSAPAGATLGATAITATEAAGLGLTATEAASLGLSATEFAAASVGGGLLTTAELAQLDLATGGSGGTLGAETLGKSIATGSEIATDLGLTGGSSLLTGEAAGITAESVAQKLAEDAALFPPAVAPPITTPTTVVPPTGVPPVVPPTGVPPVVPPTGVPPIVSTIAKSLIPTAVSGLFSPSNTSNLSNLFSGGLTTAGSLLQQQASKEAALAAQQRIDAETAAAKQSAAFRPVGMTTRFGTSQFGYDPTTGQMTSAGYTLSPEAKAQQDRFVALSNQGLTQAEGAQAQFAPLQTGAQNLFSLGNQYISQTPQSVAQNYLNQQMALLQPGRELELATLQNKLQQQGRGGLSVSQGGTMGATTPELQALYNARAQQEAVLAANAQQAGQRDVLFGAGLLGQGSQAMGQYYGGQQAAYAPYATAQGQVQALETLGQQPFNMSNALAQQTSTAGARTGQLGLTGAQLSTNLATSANATANPYAQALMAAGNPNAMFGQSLNNVFSGLFNGFPQGSLTSGFTPSSIAASEAGLPIDYSFYS